MLFSQIVLVDFAKFVEIGDEFFPRFGVSRRRRSVVGRFHDSFDVRNRQFDQTVLRHERVHRMTRRHVYRHFFQSWVDDLQMHVAHMLDVRNRNSFFDQILLHLGDFAGCRLPDEQCKIALRFRQRSSGVEFFHDLTKRIESFLTNRLCECSVDNQRTARVLLHRSGDELHHRIDGYAAAHRRHLKRGLRRIQFALFGIL